MDANVIIRRSVGEMAELIRRRAVGCHPDLPVILLDRSRAAALASPVIEDEDKDLIRGRVIPARLPTQSYARNVFTAGLMSAQRPDLGQPEAGKRNAFIPVVLAVFIETTGHVLVDRDKT